MGRDVYKNYYPVATQIKERITKREREEERKAYFQNLEKCINDYICSECGQSYQIDDTWLKDEIYERQFSGTCRKCQHELFGVV